VAQTLRSATINESQPAMCGDSLMPMGTSRGFKIMQDGSLNFSGGARGGKDKGKIGGNPDRCVDSCGESAQLAGQMGIIPENGKPSCQNVPCGAGGVAPPC
jgi:hypothetical protein